MLLRNLLAFGRLLRRLGLDVHPGRMTDVVDALAHVDIRVRGDVYHTCRALLVHRREDLTTFDLAFDAFWGRERRLADGARRSDANAAPRDDGAGALADADQGGERPGGQDVRPGASRQLGDDDLAASDKPAADGVWSDVARLTTKDFAEFTASEVAVARAALARLVWRPGTRRTRRWVSGAGPRVDVRRALHRSLRTGGEIVSLPRRRRRIRERPLVLICDVSGSMARYSRMLLHFAHAIGRRHRLEVFLFSTRLTRVTADLRSRTLDEAASSVSRAVPDWSGGTRIGEALRELHVGWRRRALNGGPVVLLISDGWDRGDPDVLRDQIARLQRNCHRLIWLNPLIGTADYAPLTRGLRAALPFVDDFLPARTLLDLADLAVQLNALAPGGRAAR